MEIKEILTDKSIFVYCEYNNTLSVSECSLIDTVDPLDNKCNALYFNRVFVHPEVRNNGIGTKLVKRMLELVDGYDLPLCCDINSYGDLDYDALYQWYLNLGFKSYKKKFKNIIFTQLWFNLSINT